MTRSLTDFIDGSVDTPSIKYDLCICRKKSAKLAVNSDDYQRFEFTADLGESGNPVSCCRNQISQIGCKSRVLREFEFTTN